MQNGEGAQQGRKKLLSFATKIKRENKRNIMGFELFSYWRGIIDLDKYVALMGLIIS